MLAGSSPLFDLQNFFGSEPTFALPRPLTIKPGYVVGITVPTWAPAFAVNLGDDMQWRSSRDPKNCDDVRQDAAQDIRGSARTYGCVYKTARLLYTRHLHPGPEADDRAEEDEVAERLCTGSRRRYDRAISTEGWIFMVGFRVFDVGLLILWLVWFFRLRDDDDDQTDDGVPAAAAPARSATTARRAGAACAAAAAGPAPARPLPGAAVPAPARRRADAAHAAGPRAAAAHAGPGTPPRLKNP